MANWASTVYAIEGSEESLKKIYDTIITVMNVKDNRYEEYKACELLGFTEEVLDKHCLGGVIEEEPHFDNGTLRFYAEERWGLQDFNDLLKEKFPDITVYWVVEESGCEVYATNDKEGKYFPERYWVDTCINDNYQSEYFRDKDSVYKWLSKITNGKVTSEESIEAFNEEHEDAYDENENFINIHEFEVMD